MEGTGLTKHLGGIALAALLAVALAAPPALAATLTVHKTKGDFSTIQAALDAAAPGDTVRVKAKGGTGVNGEYHEPWLIITKKLEFICDKKTVIDGSIPSGVAGFINSPAGPVALPGHGLLVVNFPGFTFVPGPPALPAVPARLADGTVVRNCTFRFWRGENSEPDISGTFPKPPLYTSGEGDCLRIGRDDGQFAGDAIGSRTGVVDQSGGVNDVIVKKNHFIGCEDDGLDLRGVEYQVIKNKSIGNDDDGYKFEDFQDAEDNNVGPDRGLIRKNLAFGNDDEGFEMDGGSNTIYVRNTAVNNNADGFDCNTIGADVGSTNRYIRNLADANDGEGFKIQCDGTNLERNIARGNEDEGYDIDSNGNVLDRNIARANADDGFETDDESVKLVGNKSEDNEDDGFDVDCDDSACDEISRNVAIRNTDQGFRFTAIRSTINNNKATWNEDEGFECNSCEGVSFVSNTSTDNGGHGFFDTNDDDLASAATNTYKNNTSLRNAEDGMRFTGSNSGSLFTFVVEENEVKDNKHDGIDVGRGDDGASKFKLTKNKVEKNHGAGIENSDKSTDFKLNKLKGNGVDIAGKGGSIGGTGTVDIFDQTLGVNFFTGGVDVLAPGTGSN